MCFRTKKNNISTTQTPPIKMQKSDTKKLVNLGITLLNERQETMGYLYSSVRNAVTISDPTERTRIQQNLSNSVAFIGIAHIMTIVEKSFNEKYWSSVLSKDDCMRLKAYKHIRACTINGLTGDRVLECKMDFTSVMKSPNPIKGIRRWSSNKIEIEESLLTDSIQDIRQIIDKAIVSINK